MNRCLDRYVLLSHTACIKNQAKVLGFNQTYANDTQIVIYCTPSETEDTVSDIGQCLSNVRPSMFHNTLQTDDDKIEAILVVRNELTTDDISKINQRQ